MNHWETKVVSVEEGIRESDPEVGKHKSSAHKDHDKAVDPDTKQLIDNENVVPEKDAKEDKADSAPDATVQISKETTAEMDAKDGHTTDLSTIQFGNISEVTSKERDLAALSFLSDAQLVYHQQTTFISALPPLISPEFNVINGTRGSDNLIGTPGNDRIFGLDGNDILSGLAGNDILDGGAGRDIMFGGLGNDIYYVNDGLDYAFEFPGGGIDTVYTTVSYSLNFSLAALNAILVAQGMPPSPIPANDVENLISLSLDPGFIFLNGNDLNNTIRGNISMDVINGGAGADTMIGGLGDDQYFVNNVGDDVQEKSNEGLDQVYTTISYTLPQNVEVLLGTAPNITLTGNSLDNIINAVQSNTTLIGGLGNDLYVVRHANDTVIENPGEGIDEIQTDISLVLPDNVERLYAFGTDPISLTGNALDNFIINNVAGNVITGGLGKDIFAFNVIDTGHDTVTDYSLAESEILSFNHVTDTDGIPGLGIQDLKNMVTSVEHPNGGADTKFNFGAGQSVTLEGVVVSNVDDAAIAPHIQVFG